MDINYRIKGLSESLFQNFFNMDEQELKTHKAKWMKVTDKPGFPCRISLQDAEIGEEILLINYQHLSMGSPYDSSGAIFIRKGVEQSKPAVNEIPLMFHHRVLSLRGFDENGMMLDATVTNGDKLHSSLVEMFSNIRVSFIQIHNASPGCYNCSVERV